MAATEMCKYSVIALNFLTIDDTSMILVSNNMFLESEYESSNQSQIDSIDIIKSKMAATEMGEFCNVQNDYQILKMPIYTPLKVLGMSFWCLL